MTELEARLRTLWAGLERSDKPTGPALPPVAWSPAYTPLFPGAWPPAAGMTWVRYAYAHGQDLQLRDGVRVAGPWAKVMFGAETTVVALAGRLDVIGTQGVRPLRPEELRLRQSGGDVEAHARALKSPPDLARAEIRQLRAYYRAWLADNGVIADRLRPWHTEFLAWLADAD